MKRHGSRVSVKRGNPIANQFSWTDPKLLRGEALESDGAAALENISLGTASALVTPSAWV